MGGAGRVWAGTFPIGCILVAEGHDQPLTELGPDTKPRVAVTEQQLPLCWGNLVWEHRWAGDQAADPGSHSLSVTAAYFSPFFFFFFFNHICVFITSFYPGFFSEAALVCACGSIHLPRPRWRPPSPAHQRPWGGRPDCFSHGTAINKLQNCSLVPALPH